MKNTEEKDTAEQPKKNFYVIIILALSSVVATVTPAMYFKIIELYEDKSKQKDERILQLEHDRKFWMDSYFDRRDTRPRDTT